MSLIHFNYDVCSILCWLRILGFLIYGGRELISIIHLSDLTLVGLGSRDMFKVSTNVLLHVKLGMLIVDLGGPQLGQDLCSW